MRIVQVQMSWRRAHERAVLRVLCCVRKMRLLQLRPLVGLNSFAHFLQPRGPEGQDAFLAAGLLDDPSYSGTEKLSRFLQCFERLRALAGHEKREREAKMGVEI